MTRNAPLPDIPPAIAKCLADFPQLTGKGGQELTANETVTILLHDSEAKRACAARLFSWYRERQAAALPDGHPKTAAPARPAKRAPLSNLAPTWD